MKISEELTIAASQSFKEREYWLRKLSGELPQSNFPYDRGNKGISEPRPDVMKFEFSKELSLKMLKISNASDSRLHMILVAVVFALLARYTGNRDIIVGAPVVKQAIEGEFINTVLTLRISLGKRVTFKELILVVRKTLIEAVENQNYPVETLLYDLNLTFSKTQFPLFDIAVLLKNIHDKTYIRHIPVNLIFSFLRTAEGMEGVLEYNSLLYRKTTIERITRHLKHFLAQVLDDVTVLVEDLVILYEEERYQLVREFNATRVEYPREKSIQALFEEEVTKYPDHVALVGEEEGGKGRRVEGKKDVYLSYKELNERSNQLAYLLKEKGVRLDTIAGIMMERSLEMIVGLLGILKAGGAYLPIDPDYPEERIDFMLKDSTVKFLVIKSNIISRFAFRESIEVIFIDKVLNKIGPKDTTIHLRPLPAPVTCLAYIIYTSGTTGQPKGVMIEHASIVNTLVWRRDYYRFQPMDIVLQVPSFSFDSSVEDIFTPLISGAKLILVPHRHQFDPDYLSELTAKNSITHFLMVPVFYGTFLEGGAERLKHVKTITAAGDSFTPGLLKLHFERLKGVRLFNEYGPTENSVCSTVYEFSPGRSDILIGKPIHNVCCYIVDGKGELTPLGVPGELWLSGAGLARGYLNNPELTTEKFIEQVTGVGGRCRWEQIKQKFLRGSGGQFLQKEPPGRRRQRIYQTGDLVRWLEGGNIEFLGRVDQQVKIRGFRIEPGEIENRMLRHPGIKEAVVVPRVDPQGNKYLCAFIVIETAASTGLTGTGTGAKLEVADMIEHLAECLPDHMIPAHFAELPEIPLTPNGKVDRKKLSEMKGNIEVDTQYEAPRNEIEKQLAEIWKNELGLEKVGIYDNYFNIGGDSIKSIRLVHLINHAFHKELKIVDLYINNTIEKLAARLMKQLSPGPGEDAYRLEVLQEVDALKKRVLKGE